MITAKEIHRKKFEKVKFGYSPDDVDAFMTQLEADVRLMEQELADSGEKISLLADKVREYKETEDDMRNALVGAQKQARQVIEAANEKAAQIEAEARAQVGEVQERKIAEQEAQLKSLTEQIAQQTALLDATKKHVAEFRQSLFDMYRAQIAQIAKLPGEIVTPAAETKAEEQPAEAAPTEAAEDKLAETPAEPAPAAEQPAQEQPAETPAEEQPAETAEEKPAEAAEEQSAEPAAEEKPAEPAVPEQPEEKPAVTGTETVTEDPFAGASRRKSSPETRFGGRGDKKKRS